MTMLELFNKITHGAYAVTVSNVSWKVEDGIMMFEQSRELDDWRFNLMALPWSLKIKGKWIITTLGWALVWYQIKPIVIQYDLKGFAGYSHGGIPASLASAETGKHAVCFGTPNVAIMTKKTKSLFWNVTYYQNENDLMNSIPPVYSKGGRTILLPIPEGLDLGLIGLTGHTAKQYRAALVLL